MPVLQLFNKSNFETIETLEWMLQEARRGRLTDFFGGFRHDGVEKIARTCIYRIHPSKVIRAMVRMNAEIAFEESAIGP